MARRQFDFWLGSWDCSWPGGSARNEVTVELDGMAVVERFSSDELQGISAPLPPDSLVRHWEREGDRGWEELWRIDYRRRGTDG